MSDFAKQAYEMLITSWGVDGDHDLRVVADVLDRGDADAAVRELDYVLGFVRAQLRAYLTLRSALVMKDADLLRSIAEKDASDIDDWPGRVEV